jgi:hypothetical protein
MSDGRLRSLRVGHFDKREATGLARVAIRYNVYSLYATVSGESGMQVILRCLITEISDKYVGHSIDPLILKLSLSDSSETNLNKKEGLAAGRHSVVNTDARKDTLSVADFCGVASEKGFPRGGQKFKGRILER